MISFASINGIRVDCWSDELTIVVFSLFHMKLSPLIRKWICYCNTPADLLHPLTSMCAFTVLSSWDNRFNGSWLIYLKWIQFSSDFMWYSVIKRDVLKYGICLSFEGKSFFWWTYRNKKKIKKEREKTLGEILKNKFCVSFPYENFTFDEFAWQRIVSEFKAVCCVCRAAVLHAVSLGLSYPFLHSSENNICANELSNNNLYQLCHELERSGQFDVLSGGQKIIQPNLLSRSRFLLHESELRYNWTCPESSNG